MTDKGLTTFRHHFPTGLLSKDRSAATHPFKNSTMRFWANNMESHLLAIFVTKALLSVLLRLVGDIGIFGGPKKDLVNLGLTEKLPEDSRLQSTNDVARILLGVIFSWKLAAVIFVV